MQHISIRVPWRDRAWDGHICDHAVDNASCILLKNIGDKRDDEYESEHAGEDIATLDTQRVPCLSERGTFMSPAGYSLTKTHPYSYAAALKPHLRPSAVNMPGYAFEAVPFRWMARNSFEEEVLPNWEPTYDPEAEDRAVKIVGAKSTAWIMDGHNQSSVIRSFFEPVTPGQSLVFIYLKHSPFQEEASRKVLVGAAHVSEVQLPGMWNQVGEPPFPSSMWETAVVHSLRPDMRAGILLPYQSLIPLLDEGMDVDRAIAWAPEDRGTEFAYVTEHVSDDGAIGALESLRDAATGFSELGIELPQTGMAWVEDQIERLWRDRGPTPGLGSVLKYLGVEAAYPTANHLEMQLPKGVNPWTTLETYLGGAVEWPEQVRHRVPKSVGAIWTSLDGADRDALKLLSALDITADQVEMLFEDNATEDLSREELVANPYYAAICSHQHPLQVSFNTVDRAVFPAPHVTWESPLPAESQMSDPRDRRRVEAFVTDLLEEMAQEGDTLSGLPEIIERANLREFVRPLKLSPELLRAYGLDGADGGLEEAWSPVVATKLADMSPALKLRRLEVTKCVILESLEARRTARRYVPSFDSRSEIDRALPKLAAIAAEEELARLEKAAGLEELYSSRLSVLVGPAGTGKTTLLRALAELPDVADKGILLLAPTGKAAVQLKTKVGQEAHTLASFLIKKNGYDTYTGQYMPVASNQRVSFGTVVIDEASMLTEEMLAATLSALGKVDRLVLVGDPRQLPLSVRVDHSSIWSNLYDPRGPRRPSLAPAT